MYDLQRASFWRRLASFIFDFIILIILAVGFSFITAVVVQYDKYNDELNSYYEKYEKEFDVSFNLSSAEIEKLEDDEKLRLEQAYEKLNKDEKAVAAHDKIANLALIIPSIGIFIAFLIIDFIIPLILKNGQTLGKKLFGVCVVKNNGVVVTPVMMFVRTIIGKYAIETMIPLSQLIMFYFSNFGLLNIFIVCILVITQLILLFTTRKHTVIHDLLAYTATADMATQIIFETEEELIKCKNNEHKEKANRSPY